MLDKTPRFVRLNSDDNVVVCVDRVAAGPQDLGAGLGGPWRRG